jgi:Pregnancy-associated plasma protein-A/Secretion system C-terminal sorting domain
MRKIYIYLFLLSFTSSFLLAQRPERCGTVQRVAQSLADHPELSLERKNTQSAVAQFLAANPSAKTNGGVTVIPVVVHVIYRTANANISTAQVQSQINILNQDFRRTNTDASLTRAEYLSIVGDCQIEFCLATQDPLGAATDGITRNSTTTTNIGGGNTYYTLSPAWNRNNYLNIWVCEIGGGLLGFAYPPGSAPAQYDGVVIDYRYFGNQGTAQAPYNKGRTCTHEVGHFLNLEHIWADDSGCTIDDGVADTPKQTDEHYDCVFTYNTCVDVPFDYHDMVENYMDYTEDACMNAFTLGQGARMRSAISVSRPGLATSNGCLATAVNDALGTIQLEMNPNPAAQEVRITWSQNNHKPAQVQLINALGAVVWKQDVSGGRQLLDVSQFPAGMYMLRVEQNGVSATKKLMVQH